MVVRGFLLAALAVAGCACAVSTAPEGASLRRAAIYMVGDNAPLPGTYVNPADLDREGRFPVVRRVYWFFAGR